jgi:hypothetical protein
MSMSVVSHMHSFKQRQNLWFVLPKHADVDVRAPSKESLILTFRVRSLETNRDGHLCFQF